MKILLALLLFSSIVLSQNLKNIPDENLRAELNKQGFTTNDSLDPLKVHGLLQLDLKDLKIKNLNGLQYFNRVWMLDVSNNQISKLEYLPPNLTTLSCSNNKLTKIDSLPLHLKQLGCSNNQISTIQNLPISLISIYFGNNKMTYFPNLSENIQNINYFNNPLQKEKVPTKYQPIDCINNSQNCLPNELIKWNILKNNISDSINNVIKIEVKLFSRYSWGMGNKEEIIVYKRKEGKLISKEVSSKRDKGNSIKNGEKRITKQSIPFKQTIRVSDLELLLSDIFKENLYVSINQNDSLKIINLKNKRNGGLCTVSCEDCSWYDLNYTIITASDSITLTYHFSGAIASGVTICSTDKPENLKSIIDWLYNFKLANLLLPDNEIKKRFFNEKNLKKIIDWDKKYEHTTRAKQHGY